MKKILSALIALMMAVSMFAPGAIFAAEIINLALGKTATSSGVEGSTVVEAYAVDGIKDYNDNRTRWGSNRGHNTKWLQVDLGEKKEFLSIVLDWERKNANSYSISVSDNGTDFTPIKVFTDYPAEFIDVITLDAPVSARYVRLSISSFRDTDVKRNGEPVTWDTVSLFEFEIYGYGEKVMTAAEVLDELTAELSADGKTVSLPESADPNFTVIFAGSEAKEIVALDGTVHTPLVDKTVNLMARVQNKNNANDTAEGNVAVTIPGRVPVNTGNAEPVVIPSLREWLGGEGSLTITDTARLVIADEALRDAAEYTQADFKDLFGFEPAIVAGAPANGDIYLSLDDTFALLGEEGYYMNIGDFVSIEAPAVTGAFYGTRTVLQILKASEDMTMPKGETRDYPKYEQRGFHIDVARKFVPLYFLQDYLKLMSWYKMNFINVHLSDNGFRTYFSNDWNKTYSAFRLESEKFPGLTSTDGSYTKEEFRQLQLDGRAVGVDVMPEIDTPAHALQFTKYGDANGLDLWSTRYGMDHFDITKPDVFPFIKGLFEEYITGENPVFLDKVNIGTDEYDNTNSAVNEIFRTYTNDLLKLAKDNGKRPYLWGALSDNYGNTVVDPEGATMLCWSNNYAQPAEMAKLGWDMISINELQTYSVPAAGYYADYIDTRGRYESWEANVMGDVTFPLGHPQVKGGAFAVWNDIVGNGISVDDIHDRLFPAMAVFSEKLWQGTRADVRFTQFQSKANTINEAPRANISARLDNVPDNLVMDIPFESTIENTSDYDMTLSDTNVSVVEDANRGKVAKFTGNASYIETSVPDVGFGQSLELSGTNLGVGEGWTLSMFIKPDADNPDDAVLLESDKGTVKLKQTDTGKLGYSKEVFENFVLKDNYNHRFNYEVPEDTWTNIVMTGNNRGTSLYVNGVFVERRETNGVPGLTGSGGELTRRYVETLVLPTARIGSETNSFKGLMDELKIYNRVLSDVEIETLAGINNQNLAYGKPATASSVEGDLARLDPNNVTDGDRTDMQNGRWASKYTNNEWITVDLGQKYVINKTLLYWESHGRDYKIQVSVDGINFKDVFSRTGFGGGVDTIEFDPVIARYVKMQGIARGTGYGYSLFEFEVFGPDATDIPVSKLTAEAGSQQPSDDISKAFDGDTSTMWHTLWGTGAPREDHYAIIHLAEPAIVDGFRYLPRQSETNGIVTSYEIQVSCDNGANYQTVATGAWASTPSWKNARFELVEGVTDVKFISLASLPTTGSQYTSAAELRVTQQVIEQTPITYDLLGNVVSPDGTLKMNLYDAGRAGIAYDITKDGEVVTEISKLGIRTTTAGNFTGDVTLSRTEAAPAPLTEAFTMVSGKQLEISETYNQSIFYFEDTSGNEIGIEARLFDEGVGFRYLIDGEEGTTSQVPQNGELTEFNFNGDSDAWYMPYDADHDRPYRKATAAGITGSINMHLMTKVSPDEDLYALLFPVIVDASYGGIALQGGGDGTFTTRFNSAQGSTSIDITLPFASPWRVLAVGTAADIAETNLAEVLAPPSVLADSVTGKDPAWIQPGVSAWTWYNRDSMDNLERFKQYVDLAADLGWKYLLVDEGWQNRNGGRAGSGGYAYYGISDWAKELIAYADSKGVGILAWFNKVDLVNKGATSSSDGRNLDPGTPRTQEEMNAYLKEFADAGIKGIKPDFFTYDNQAGRREVDMLTKACAENGLMINYHGLEQWPGVRRTQPHIVSVEGVFGEEQNLWDSSHDLPSQLTMLPFIRNSIGNMDYTPAYSFLSYNGSSAEYARTLTASTALTVVFENGLQCLADIVEHYETAASKNFFKNLPSAWDETKLLGGAPSDFVVMGRRSGETWYVGAISDNAKAYELDLDFLGEGEYYASIYTDGTDEAPKYGMSESGMFGQYQNRSGIIWTDIDFEERTVTKADTISFEMLAKGGAAIRFSRTPSTSWTEDSAEIAPNPIEVEKGETAQATLVFSESIELEQREWSVADESIATVTQDGIVTGVATGATTLIATNPNREGVQVTAEIVVLEALTLNNPWYVTTPVPENVAYNSSASVTIQSGNGDWYRISDTNGKQVSNLHLYEVPTEENMEITSELTFNAQSNYNSAGIVFYLEDGNMVTVERRFHDGLGNSIFALVGNKSAIGSGSQADTTEGNIGSGLSVADTKPGEKCEIRLVKTGNVYTAYYRYFGETAWQKIATTYENANIGSASAIKVGLFALNGSGGSFVSRPAMFENFTLDGEVLPFTDYKVSFESNGGSDVRYMIADIDGTEILEQPADPVKEGFEFAGWFTDEALTAAFDFDTAITSDMTLYAKWTEGAKELSLTVDNSGDIITATLKNNTETAVAGQLILAFYNDKGQMTHVEYVPFDLSTGEIHSLGYIVPAERANDTYKVFVWDESFQPLLETASGSVVQ